MFREFILLTEASEACEAYGIQLAEINTLDDINSVLSTLLNNDFNQVWIGVIIKDKRSHLALKIIDSDFFTFSIEQESPYEKILMTALCERGIGINYFHTKHEYEVLDKISDKEFDDSVETRYNEKIEIPNTLSSNCLDSNLNLFSEKILISIKGLNSSLSVDLAFSNINNSASLIANDSDTAKPTNCELLLRLQLSAIVSNLYHSSFN